MKKSKLLIVEDDPNLGEILNEYLIAKGYETILCRDGEAGLQAFLNEPVNLCILDVMLPKKDGFTLGKEIKQANRNMPILFLTAKSMKEDTIEGFKIGADDYVNKPFSMEELLYRIQAILRRTSGDVNEKPKKQIFKIGAFEFHYDIHILKIEGEEKKLTSKEADLLRLLCINANRTLERGIALKAIWHDDSYFNARSMDVYIAKLRKYLKPDPSIEIITERGMGFKLVEKSDPLTS